MESSGFGLKASEYEGRFSFDSRWLSYFSYQTGRPEVYERGALSWRGFENVSTTGGWLARFSRNELFYRRQWCNDILGRWGTQNKQEADGDGIVDENR